MKVKAQILNLEETPKKDEVTGKDYVQRKMYFIDIENPTVVIKATVKEPDAPAARVLAGKVCWINLFIGEYKGQKTFTFGGVQVEEVKKAA